MAYAAVSSLIFTIHTLLDSPRISVVPSTRESQQSAYNAAQWLAASLRIYRQVVSPSIDRIIIEEARRLEDAIEFAVSAQFLEQSAICRSTFSINLHHSQQDADRFAEIAKKMNERIKELWVQNTPYLIEEEIQDRTKSDDEAEEVTEMVGLRNEFRRLRDAFAEPHDGSRTSFLHSIVFWISGMAGVGKTTIAKRLYHDPLVKANFEHRAFVKVGRQYRVERVLRAISTQLHHGHEEMNDEDLFKRFRSTLSSRRCLIVLDDVWDNALEELVERNREIKCCGSLILVTSRMAPVFPYKSRSWKMRLLNEEESWELLKSKVFGEEEVCPPRLVKPGKKIAEKCGGLPLLIIAVAGILCSKVERNPKSWKRVAEKPNSVLEEASHQISEVLISSYHHLHETYKLYFLYIVVFPQNYVVGLSTIINLWFAEGFYYFVSEFTWENEKSHGFRELLQKNLVISGQERSWSSNEIKSCSLHIAYWYLCKRVAKDNGFMYVMNSYQDGMDECVESHNRLAIQTNVLLAIKEVRDRIASVLTVRSMLCTGPYNQYQVPLCFEWKILRVLDALTIRFYEFPVEVVELILLRYLSLTCNANIPHSISKLWRLQFLIVRRHSMIRQVGVETYLPVEIWELQELIHLEIMGRNLPDPPHPGVVLSNLKKLLDVGASSCTKGILESMPKLKKLRIQIDLAPDVAETLIFFYGIESFQSVVMNPTLLHCPPPPLLSIPILGIRKLSLSGFGYPWEEMTKIAKLPNLYAMKLRCYAFRGETWEANEEMRFSSIRYLYIEDTDLVRWTATNCEHMPHLEGLTMKNCYKLHEIPRFSSGSLKIEFVDCNPLVETWAKQKYGNVTRVTFTASYSWKKKNSKP